MKATDLVDRIQSAIPEAGPVDCLRYALGILAIKADADLEDEASFKATIDEVRLRLDAARDQFAAVAHEMDQLARIDPLEFAPEQIWSLVRSIKVHSQLLTLYAETGTSPATQAIH